MLMMHHLLHESRIECWFFLKNAFFHMKGVTLLTTLPCATLTLSGCYSSITITILNLKIIINYMNSHKIENPSILYNEYNLYAKISNKIYSPILEKEWGTQWASLLMLVNAFGGIFFSYIFSILILYIFFIFFIFYNRAILILFTSIPTHTKNQIHNTSKYLLLPNNMPEKADDK